MNYSHLFIYFKIQLFSRILNKNNFKKRAYTIVNDHLRS